MTDYNSRFPANRNRRADPYNTVVRLDYGIEGARTLRVAALLGIATRLFYIYASASRISVTHTLLGLVGANGQIDLSSQPDGGASLVAQGHDADTLVTAALVASVIVIILFVLALGSLGRRKKRGDAFAAAIDKNRAIRLASRGYLLIVVASIVARSAFSPGPGASPADRLHTLLDGDTATIGLQIAVITVLLLFTLAIGREIGKARAEGSKAPSRRRWLRARLEGLSWWQAMLAVLPMALVGIGGAIGGGIGGAIGGGIGGAAAAVNLVLARKQILAAIKALLMTSVCAVACGALIGVRAVLLWTPAPPPLATPAAQQVPHGTDTIQPPGDAGWQNMPKPRPSGVVINPPSVIRATGARLSWPAYVNTSGKTANDLVAYEVYRGTNESFTPSASTLVASVSAHETSYTDSSATAFTNPLGNPCYYMVAVRTRSGKLITGPTRLVTLPQAGRTEIVLSAVAATTLSSALPSTVAGPLIHDGMGQPRLEAGNDERYGTTRAVFEFGPLDALPSDARVVEARLSLWGDGTDTSQYTLYQLTRSFISSQSTWKNAAAGTAWTTSGGDYATPAGIGLPGSGDDPLRCDFDATAIVRGWITSPGSEHGLLLKANQETPSSQVRVFFINSDDQQYFLGTTLGQGPALVISYTMPSLNI
jgi:hypothetical protein